ncbi:MAG: chemotaxis protein CheW [Anaerolineae bacterium]|nr:chemotaxis protein CheW [Anaerolineae bacterium]
MAQEHETSMLLLPGLSVGDERARQILMRRLAALAKPPVKEDWGEQYRLVIFRLGKELYGIDATCVFSVRPAETITRVPRVPEWVAGVINLRGRIFSVIDLKRFFGLPQSEEGGEDAAGQDEPPLQLIVVETPQMEIGFLVDDVLAVESIPLAWLQDAGSVIRGLRPEYVRGVTLYQRDGEHALVVLDVVAMLSDERLIVHEEVV